MGKHWTEITTDEWFALSAIEKREHVLTILEECFGLPANNVPINCQHRRIIGDNNGETCMDCGEHLAGYGKSARGGSPCRHTPQFNAGADNFCMYCETFQDLECQDTGAA